MVQGIAVCVELGLCAAADLMVEMLLEISWFNAFLGLERPQAQHLNSYESLPVLNGNFLRPLEGNHFGACRRMYTISLLLYLYDLLHVQN